MNIPIYRAKKIDSDVSVIGWLIELQGKLYIAVELTTHKGYVEIDSTTLAIHFPDMLDSQGNKIFASMQENKKHGDIIHNIIAPNNFGKMIVYWNSYRNAVCYEEEKYCTPLQFLLKDELKDYEIIGIQK